MKKGRGKKRLIVGLTVLLIAAAAVIGGQVCAQTETQGELLRWDIFAYEVLLLAGGYGLAAVIGKRNKKHMRKGVPSHVG